MLEPAGHIRVANVGGDLVFLDLACDAYFSLGADAAIAARAALEGTPVGDDEIVHELVGAGILVSTSRALRAPYLVRRPPTDYPEPERVRFRLGQFLEQCVTAVSVARAIRDADPRSWSDSTATGSCAPLPDTELFELAAHFCTFRALIPGTGRCLVQSMMLARILRKRGVACEWVFGVRTHPFAAHCWIEARGYVLNDFADHVAWYVPIAVL
jgi:hypothetical protein